MNTEELVTRLEHINVPRMEFASHRQQLKQYLAETNRLPQQPVNITELLRSKMRHLTGSLIAHQPVWKILFISSAAWIAIAVIIAFVFFAPVSNKGINAAMAADLALNNPQIKAMLPADGATTVTATDIGNHKIAIFIQRHSVYINAEVDAKGVLQIKKITHITPLFPQQGDSGLTAEENEQALSLAKADARVQALLDGGASISRVEVLYCNVVTNNIDIGKITNVKERLVFVQLWSEQGEKGFLVNLETGVIIGM